MKTKRISTFKGWRRLPLHAKPQHSDRATKIPHGYGDPCDMACARVFPEYEPGQTLKQWNARRKAQGFPSLYVYRKRK